MPKKKIPCLETFLRFSVPNAALTAGNACASEWKWQRQTTSEGDSRQPTDNGRQTAADNRRTADGRQMEDELRERTPNGTERSARLSRLRRWENENGESDRRSRSNSGSCLLLLLRYSLCLGSARGVCVLYAALRCVTLRIRPVDTNLWQ